MILLILVTCLSAQDNWSSARQLSNDGVYPEGYMYPAITVDGSGTIHAFWTYVLPESGGSFPSYSQIEYRKSTDGGLTWSITDNLTPGYIEHRIMYMKAVCDSKNNVHLVYMRGSEGYEVLYKKFDGITWTEPELIGYGSSNLQMNIDSEDRIYAIWLIGYSSYFAYRDEGIWSDYIKIGDKEYKLKDIKFDRDDLLYAVGYFDLKPYLFIYDKLVENWIKFEEMPNDSIEAGRGCAISQNDTLFINKDYDVYANSKDLHLNMDMNTGIYSPTYEYGEKNNPNKKMFIDNYNYIHLFETHYYTEDIADDTSIIHSTGKNGIWETVVIDSSNENHSYSEPNVAFDKVNNKFYLTYYKFDKVNEIGRIYFRSKQNTTGIEGNDELLVNNYVLEQNYPNPFNNQTEIAYSLARKSHVELSVFNTKGEIVSVLVNLEKSKGKYSISFNADELNSGIYYYQLKINGILSSVKRMILLK